VRFVPPGPGVRSRLEARVAADALPQDADCAVELGLPADRNRTW
jgi:hypothetical protein